MLKNEIFSVFKIKVVFFSFLTYNNNAKAILCREPGQDRKVAALSWL